MSSKKYRKVGLWRTLASLYDGKLHEILQAEWERQGDIAFFRIGTYNMILLSDPADVRHVLQEVPRRYGKSLPAVQKLLGEGISNAEGELWRKHRLFLKGSFSHQKLNDYFPLTWHSARQVVDGLSDGEPISIDLETLALQVTRQVIFHALFGEDSRGDARLFTASFESLVSNQVWLALQPQFMARWPVPWVQAFHRDMGRIDEFVYLQMRATDRQREERGTILAQLMGACNEAGSFLFSDGEVRDDIVSLMLAGYETTSASLGWVLALLATRPQLVEKLRSEALSAFSHTGPDYRNLSRLTLARAVVNETLRLYPPGWAMRRLAVEQDRLPSGLAIAPGDFIMISPFVLQRHPDHWEAPNEFRPERFEDGTAIRAKGYAFIPFGGGPRRCLGMNFAYMELLIVLAMLFRRGEWKMAVPDPLPINSRGTMRLGVPLALQWTPQS